MSVKFLLVILDSRLTWKEDVDVKVREAHNSMRAYRRACGVTWDLRTRVVHWFYVTIIRQYVTITSVVWWTVCQTAYSKRKLSRIQRLACLGITGTIRTTPANAVEAFICLPCSSLCFRVKRGQLHIDSGVWDDSLTYIPIEDTVLF